MEGFTPPQAEVLERGFLSSEGSWVLHMATGSGKTWLARRAMVEAIAKGHRAIYLAPLRALAEELAGAWQAALPGLRVGLFTGDYGTGGKRPPVPFREAQLLIMTPERLDACLRHWRSHWHWLPEVDLVVIDELHLLGEAQRGARLEGTVGRLRRLNPFVRFVGLSATMGNREELATWLGGRSYEATWRPIPLQWRVVRYRKATEKPGLLRTVVQPNMEAGGKSLVFVQSRRRAEVLSVYLQEAGVQASYHHAGLDHARREEVEGAFRTGCVEVVVATATLEMGLNLPVRQVVLYDLQRFDGQGFAPLTTNSVWQRAGRAGRPGLDETGEVVLLAPAWDGEAARYEQGRFEPIRSGLRCERALAEQVVTEVASGLSRTRRQLQRAFGPSLGGQQGVLADVETVVQEMLDAEMLDEVSEVEETRRGVRLRATRFGRVAVRHLIAPATVLQMKRALDGEPAYTFFDLLLVVASCDDAGPVLPVDFEELGPLAGRLGQERSMLCHSPALLTQRLPVEGKRLLAALKMALVLRAWTRTGEVEEVAEAYGCYPFEVGRLRESAERLLQAMEALLPAPEPVPELEASSGWGQEVPTLRERVQALRRMVTGGLDEQAVTLTLVDGLGPTWARRLQDEGIADIEDLALAEAAELARLRGLSEKRAQAWVETALGLIKTQPASWYEERAPRAAVATQTWPETVDPYRLRRALDLTVRRAGQYRYAVAGGLEPHRVQVRGARWGCDCADAAKGHLCKHVLAVRLRRGDRQVAALVRRLGTASGEEVLDLFRLWYG